MKKTKLILLAALLGGTIWSCAKPDEIEQPKKEEAYSEFVDSSSEIKEATFGPQTGHPFSMENVTSAYNNLATKSQGLVEPTHLYVRFMPQTEQEQDAVKAQKDIDLYQYPLDCEITEGFVGSHNPYLLNGFPQYWCVVPNDYDFSSIECAYEIESELWKPSFIDNPDTKSASSEFETELYLELCREQGLEPEFPVATKATKHYPEGYVKYTDTELGTVGIEKMEVDAFNFWHNYKAYSSSTGYLNYGGHSFTANYQYRIKFEREDFAVKNEGEHVDLEYVTDKGTGKLNQTFTGIYARYSVIFQAAARYYYMDIDIPRPPYNGTWNACLRICVYPNASDPSGKGQVGKFALYEQHPLATRPLVYVWDKDGDGNYRTSDEYYSTTIHELTHAMHYGFSEEIFKTSEERLRESLSRGVQQYLTKQRYSNYEVPQKDYFRNMYTGIVRDLTDSAKFVECNQIIVGTTKKKSSKSYYDAIDCAYSVPELIEAIKTCKTINEWKKQIKALYPGRVSDSDLDNAFEYWFE